MQIKSNYGFSLLGTLAITLGGITIGIGALKLNLNALNTAKIESTKASEEALKQTVINILSTTADCKENLNSGQITDSTIQSSTEVIQPGIFNEVINVVDMKLKDLVPQDTDKKLFYLYYSKPALGDKQKRIPDPNIKCESGDVRGCYYISCEINYKCTNADCSAPGDKCNVNVQKCGFEGKPQGDNNQTCDPNYIRTRADINSCAEIQATFLKVANVNLNPDPVNLNLDPEYLYGLAGFDENKNPKLVKLIKACPPGKYPIRIMVENDDGEQEVDIKCQILCTGDSKLHPRTNRCYCDGQTVYKQGKCQTCPQGLKWLENEKTCETCPPGKHYFRDGCIKCPDDAYWSSISNKCRCHDFREKWDSEKNKCECLPPRFVHHRFGCVRCPYGEWNGSSCPCKYNKIWIAESNYCKCPLHGQEWIVRQRTCKCRSGTYLSNGRCCPHGTRNSNGKCCPPRSHNSNGKCCPHGSHNSNGKCCPHGSHNSNGKCCPNGSRNSNGICCPNGTRNDLGICCRTGTRNDRGKCCPPGSFNDGGICCPPGSRNSNGICCPRESDNVGGSCCPWRRIRNGRCCPNDRWIQSTNTCCPVGDIKTNSGTCCPPHRYNNGTCCPVGKVNTNGRCCLPDSIIVNGKCCPTSGGNVGGICCKHGHSNINGKCCRRNNNEIICCPSGYHSSNNSNGRCCEVGYHYIGGTCCPDGFTFRNGICTQTCSSTQYFDHLNHRCLNCPAGATGNGSQCRCPGGRSWNRNNNTCN